MTRMLERRGAAQSRLPARRLAPLLAMTALTAISGRAHSASATELSAPPPSSQAPSTAPVSGSPTGNALTDALPTVTVEATEAGRRLKRKVDRFVTSTIVDPAHDSIERWNTPICLMVEGLPPESSEAVRDRVLQAATAAHAPLAGQDCTANLYIIASSEPDGLLKDMLEHNPTMYYTRNGRSAIESYLHSRRPVRVWYNTGENCASDPSNANPVAAALQGTPLESYMNDSSGLSFCSGGGSLVFHEGLPSIHSAIIVADKSRLKKISLGQLSAYVSMIALADVHLDADAGDVPTILRLFQRSKIPPQDLSRWDRALLYSVYNTNQSSTIQVSEVKAAVVQRLISTIGPQ